MSNLQFYLLARRQVKEEQGARAIQHAEYQAKLAPIEWG
jgi:hypothetical protein